MCLFDLKADEQLDILNSDGLKIIQKKDGFHYGTDAVLLADFAKNRAAGNVMDLCSGTAIVPLLLAHSKKIRHITAMEIQPDIAETAKRSVAGNSLDGKIDIICDDLNNACQRFKRQSFDTITCNPPYMKAGSAIINSADTKTISRHEVCCTLEDVIVQSRYLLRDSGRLFLVHKPNRLAEIIHTMCCHRIEPKRMRTVHSRIGKEPELVLIEGMSGAGSELRIEPPLFLYSADGSVSDELKKIYGNEV